MNYPLLPYYEQIVSSLPGSWTLEPVSPEFADSNFRAYSADACLHFRHENGRVTARPSVPFELHQHQESNAPECKTAFNVERSPALAAGQITRAILPEAVRRLALARERKAAIDGYNEKSAETIRRMTEAGFVQWADQNTLIMDRHKLYAAASGESVRFDSLYLPTDKAVKLAEFLKAL